MAHNCTPAALRDRLSDLPRGQRHLVALAGAPGSGKSTLAARLATALQPRAAVVPMDGFHFDDRILDARGHRSRKGAPETFDVAGFFHLLKRLRAADEDVAIPVFDRSLELSRGSAEVISTDRDILLIEGNYVLLQDAPWAALQPLYDLRVMIDVDEAELRQRLRDRWESIGLDAAAVEAKVEDNDLPNGRRVREDSTGIDLFVDGRLEPRL